MSFALKLLFCSGCLIVNNHFATLVANHRNRQWKTEVVSLSSSRKRPAAYCNRLQLIRHPSGAKRKAGLPLIGWGMVVNKDLVGIISWEGV